MRISMICMCMISLPVPILAQQPQRPAVEQIAPFVDETTMFVARVDTPRLDSTAVLAQLGEWASIGKTELQRIAMHAKQLMSAYEKSGGGPFFIGMSLADGWSEPFAVIPVGRDATFAFVRDVLRQSFGNWMTIVHQQAIVIGAPAVVKRVQSIKPNMPDAIRQVFSENTSSTIHGVVRIPTALRKSLAETAPQLPGDTEGKATKNVLLGWDHISFALNTKPTLSLRVTMYAKSENAAQSIGEGISGLLTHLRNNPNAKAQFGDIGTLIPLLRPKSEGKKLEWTFDQAALAKIVKPMLSRQRKAAQQAVTHNKLRQMAIAMHNYHDVHKTFPPYASHDKNGKPLVSWRVHLLPYLEQIELYKKFKLDEPWNSAHNKKLIAEMPNVFASGNRKLDDKRLTRFLVPYGENAMFSGKKGVGIRDITDGTSNTIMIVQASDKQAVAWTKPADLSMKTKDIKAALMGPKEKSFMAVLADGSSRAIPRAAELKTLRAIFTRNGGEVVDLP